MKRGNVSGEALLELFQGFPTGNTHGAVAPGMALLRGRPGSAIADPCNGSSRSRSPPWDQRPLWPDRTCPGRDVEVGENGEDGASRPVDRPLPFTSAWQICQQYPGHKNLSWHSGSVLSTLGGEGENPEGFQPGGNRGPVEEAECRSRVPPPCRGGASERLSGTGRAPFGETLREKRGGIWLISRQTVW